VQQIVSSYRQLRVVYRNRARFAVLTISVPLFVFKMSLWIIWAFLTSGNKDLQLSWTVNHHPPYLWWRDRISDKPNVDTFLCKWMSELTGRNWAQGRTVLQRDPGKTVSGAGTTLYRRVLTQTESTILFVFTNVVITHDSICKNE